MAIIYNQSEVMTSFHLVHLPVSLFLPLDEKYTKNTWTPSPDDQMFILAKRDKHNRDEACCACYFL